MPARLVLLRIALAASILLGVGFTTFSLYRYLDFGVSPGLSVRLHVGAALGLLPAVVLMLPVMRRAPPPGLLLDAIIGMSLASLLYPPAKLYVALITPLLTGHIEISSASESFTTLLPRVALFMALDAAVAESAYQVRRFVGTMRPGRIAIATAAFLIWEWLTQEMWRLFI